MNSPPTKERGDPREEAAPHESQRNPATIGSRFQAERTVALLPRQTDTSIARGDDFSRPPLSQLPEGHMRMLLPPAFNPHAPAWGIGERRARIAFVGDHISTRRYDDNRDYVTLHSPTIKQIISPEAWKHARGILMPFMEIDHSYHVGGRSKGYRWIESLRNHECTDHIFRCPVFKRQIATFIRKRLGTLGPIEERVALDLLLLGCRITDIANFLHVLPDKPGIKNEARRRDVFRASIHQIHDKSYGGISRDSNRRLHHALTRTPRMVRDHLTLVGEKAVEVDLANSQPYFMAGIFGHVIGLSVSVGHGNFYADINKHLERPYDISESNQKNELKRQILMRIYAKRQHGYAWFEKPGSRPASITTAMDAAFPGLPKCIDDYRSRNGDTALANAMQKMESSVFIDAALPALQNMGIPAIPIHDSIHCRQSHADQVEHFLREHLVRTTGLRPWLRTDGK